MTSVHELFQREKQALMETELCQGARNFVDFRGSHDPSALFIGEAPGAEEDKEGKPFVGRSGTVLDKWIEEAGLTESYAITNVVKCRPPDNRTPTSDESEQFGAWLNKEIELMDPDIIIPLGKTATRHFIDINTSFINNTCEETYETGFGTIYPLPHPAYALRSGYKPDLERLERLVNNNGDINE